MPIDDNNQFLREYLSAYRTLFDRLLKHSNELIGVAKTEHLNLLGDDVCQADLQSMTDLFSGNILDINKYQEARIRELAFWRWIAFEGYLGQDPRLFKWYQEMFMLTSYMQTGWSIKELESNEIFEIGCGPLGMIEFLPGRKKLAFDPLNNEYNLLFNKVRSTEIIYTHVFEETVKNNVEAFDLGICFNVLDHAENPEFIFDGMFSMLRPKGRFIIEVNTVREEFPQSKEHKSMHPSPFSFEKIISWIKKYSQDYQYTLQESPSPDNEFPFMAWGTKS